MAAVEMGGYVSFAGVLTFKKNQELRDIAADLPRDRVLAETDAPYLAPEPFRGKRCNPSMVAETAKVLAALGQNETAANARRLFARLTG
jgi:TatD DNase family protein